MKRVVIVTGATSGFGNFLVKHFLKNGDIVIATGRKLTDRKEIFSKERENYKNQIFELDLDVKSETEQRNLLKFLDQKNLDVDILINNAGYGLFGALEDLKMEEIREQFEVNFFGLVGLTQLLVPSLMRTKGKIFNFSSVFGVIGFPLTSAYCASKFAVEGFSESLDYELRPHGVQVCLIEPGGYRTKFSSSSNWANQSNSLYKIQTKNYLSLFEKMATRKKFQDPEDLARSVVKLSIKSKLPIRIPFGRDAKVSVLMKKLLPQNVLHQVSHKVYNKLFFKGIS